VPLSCGDPDESPMARMRLPDVPRAHEPMRARLKRLKPFAVAMAGGGEFDPWKD
jgi:tRNA-splicing ligase RtcB